MLKTKSVASPINRKADGLRILVARFRGRYLKKNRYDVWMPALGPSERLLRNFQSGRLSWTQFERNYRKELFLEGKVDASNATVKNHGQKFTLRLIKSLSGKGPVTLLCHCAERELHCHRHVLRKLILSAKI
jgi:uncharacterized protein YeaO (DUF488 family)